MMSRELDGQQAGRVNFNANTLIIYCAVLDSV